MVTPVASNDTVRFYQVLYEFLAITFDPKRISQFITEAEALHIPLKARESRDVALADTTLSQDTHYAISNDYERVRDLVHQYHHLTKEEQEHFRNAHSDETKYLADQTHTT